MVSETQNSKVRRRDLRGSVCGAELGLKVTGLLTMNWAGTGGAKEKVESGSSAQESCQLGWGQRSLSGGFRHLPSGPF